MRKILLYLTGLILLQSSTQLYAGSLGINVILSGEVQPGVYGEVELNNAPRPRVVYERPVVIHEERRYIHEAPIYLHVPPDHSSHWSRHCGEYHACGRRVYFVRSREYEPQYQRYERERRYIQAHPRDERYYENRDHHDRRDHHEDRHDRPDHHDRDDRRDNRDDKHDRDRHDH